MGHETSLLCRPSGTLKETVFCSQLSFVPPGLRLTDESQTYIYQKHNDYSYRILGSK